MSLVPFASVNGQAVVRMHLVVPAEGIWHADLALDGATDTPDPQILLLAGTTWTGATIRAIDFAGQRELRIVGGTGGWRKTVPAKQYASPAGVPVSVVLGDAAATVQEVPPVVAPTVPPSLGTAFIRESGPASLVLQQLQDTGRLQTWWMDPTGVVQTALRIPTPIVSPFVAEKVHGASGWYRIATETPGDWQPGNLFADTVVQGTISRVEHRIDRGQFWTEIMVS